MTDPIGPNRISTLVGNGKGNVDTESSQSRQGSGQQAGADASHAQDHSDQLALSSAGKVLNEQSGSVSQAIQTPQQAQNMAAQIRDAFVSGSGGADVYSNSIPSLAGLLKQPA